MIRKRFVLKSRRVIFMEEHSVRIVIVLIGMVLVGIGGFLMWRKKNLVKVCTAQVSGTVKDISQVTRVVKKRRRTFCYPIFAYSVNGVEYVQKSGNSDTMSKFNVGKSVSVFYDPSSPKRYYVAEEGKSSALGWAWIFIGVTIVIIAPFMH